MDLISKYSIEDLGSHLEHAKENTNLPARIRHA